MAIQAGYTSLSRSRLNNRAQNVELLLVYKVSLRKTELKLSFYPCSLLYSICCLVIYSCRAIFPFCVISMDSLLNKNKLGTALIVLSKIVLLNPFLYPVYCKEKLL
jgi:hypothetical protein